MEIQEQLLHYIWKFQYFNQKDLRTTQGESLIILSPGLYNSQAGPNFLHASIRLADITWHGHIALHIHGNEWKNHKHHLDHAYDNVILHVVWQEGTPASRKDDMPLPTLSLQGRVPNQLIEKCQYLLQQPTAIPCADQWEQVDGMIKLGMLERVLLERLSQKKGFVDDLWQQNKGDWEATAYQLLAYNFGFKVNSAAMLCLTQSIPLKAIKQCRADIVQLEALLIGQAGLLQRTKKGEEEVVDDYKKLLIREYTHMVHKYRLSPHPNLPFDWKFFRLRPANFPFIRLAQWAQLLNQNEHWFHWLIHTAVESLRTQLAVVQSPYWRQHYDFGKPTKHLIPGLGKASVDSIFINTIVPLWVAYGKLQGEPHYIEQAIELLKTLPAEKNTITQHYQQLGFKVATAFDSQALIALFNYFCTPKKCLSCHVGASLLHRSILPL